MVALHSLLYMLGFDEMYPKTLRLRGNLENNARRVVYCTYHTVYQAQCGAD